MKKVFAYTFGLFLSAILLIGCGGSNNQTSNQSNVTGNTPVKTNDNQAKTYNGWTTIKIEDEVEFQIPPTLELESESYKQFIHELASNQYSDIYRNTPNNVIEQIYTHQKGFNEREPQALERHASASLRIKRTKTTFPQWGETLSFTEKDLNSFENAILRSAKRFHGEVNVNIKQHPKIEKVNGVSCIHAKYELQISNEPNIDCDTYMFCNGNRLYTLGIEMRSKEFDYWTAKDVDIRNIVNTLKPCK